MLPRSRRSEDAADRVYDAMLQQYDAPGDDPQQQRDLFLQVRFGVSRDFVLQVDVDSQDWLVPSFASWICGNFSPSDKAL